jgi:hypothetical protein
MVAVPSRNIKFVCKCLGDLCMRIGDGHKPGARNTMGKIGSINAP